MCARVRGCGAAAPRGLGHKLSLASHPPPQLGPRQETKTGRVAAEEKELPLYGGMVVDGKRLHIKTLDASLATLRECECVEGGVWGGVCVGGGVTLLLPARTSLPGSASALRPPAAQEAVTLHKRD